MASNSKTNFDVNSKAVYAVIGGYEYEGQDFKTLKLFYSKTDAKNYCKQLERDYDYALMEVRKISS